MLSGKDAEIESREGDHMTQSGRGVRGIRDRQRGQRKSREGKKVHQGGRAGH